jgi:hypothetical protein
MKVEAWCKRIAPLVGRRSPRHRRSSAASVGRSDERRLDVYSAFSQPQGATTVLHQVNVRRYERWATPGDASLLPSDRAAAANE